MILNSLTKNPRRIAPFSPINRRFVSFGERQLLTLFWKWGHLKDNLVKLIKGDNYYTDTTITPALHDAKDWLMTKLPGYITTQFLTDVGRADTAESKGSKGYRKTTRMMDFGCMKSHLQQITHPNFDANQYGGRGYALRGSIRTNGHLIQLLAFKLHELQAVRYQRLPVDKMPNSLVSSIGGTDKYLMEFRNVIHDPEDIKEIWGCPPQDISILALDLGTEGLVGATVLLGDGVRDIWRKKRRKKSSRRGKRSRKKRGRRRIKSSTTSLAASNQQTTTKNFDLVVKRKAVAQPTQKLQHWIENKKHATKIGTNRTVSEVESSLPPLRGDGTSIQQYVQARRAVEADLDAFYVQSNYIKHAWDAERARDEEFSRVANSLLKMTGGSTGEHRREDQKVVIAVGLAKFVAKNGPPSLDGSFQDSFVRKVCAHLLLLYKLALSFIHTALSLSLLF